MKLFKWIAEWKIVKAIFRTGERAGSTRRPPAA